MKVAAIYEAINGINSLLAGAVQHPEPSDSRVQIRLLRFSDILISCILRLEQGSFLPIRVEFKKKRASLGFHLLLFRKARKGRLPLSMQLIFWWRRSQKNSRRIYACIPRCAEIGWFFSLLGRKYSQTNHQSVG
jgi:hypothetical protein